MGRVRTVMWDVGGVLLTNGWDHLQREKVLQHFGVPLDPFEQIHASCNDAWEKDIISVDEYLQKTVFYEPRTFTPEDFLAVMKEQSVMLPNTAFSILEQVAASDDLSIAILNNESRVLNDFRVKKFELSKYVNCFISSCYVGLRKPHPEIYKLSLELLQRDPEEIVFLDDRSENIATAKSLGMHGIVHQTAAQTAAELGQLGIAVTVS